MRTLGQMGLIYDPAQSKENLKMRLFNSKSSLNLVLAVLFPVFLGGAAPKHHTLFRPVLAAACQVIMDPASQDVQETHLGYPQGLLLPTSSLSGRVERMGSTASLKNSLASGAR